MSISNKKVRIFLGILLIISLFRDEEKKKKLKEVEILLEQIPYWWNSQDRSLRAMLCKVLSQSFILDYSNRLIYDFHGKHMAILEDDELNRDHVQIPRIFPISKIQRKNVSYLML
jgi:hypothetical protein